MSKQKHAETTVRADFGFLNQRGKRALVMRKRALPNAAMRLSAARNDQSIR
jgi:hypothetical protein